MPNARIITYDVQVQQVGHCIISTIEKLGKVDVVDRLGIDSSFELLGKDIIHGGNVDGLGFGKEMKREHVSKVNRSANIMHSRFW